MATAYFERKNANGSVEKIYIEISGMGTAYDGDRLREILKLIEPEIKKWLRVE